MAISVWPNVMQKTVYKAPLRAHVMIADLVTVMGEVINWELARRKS
jgi:hypothetical protein